MFGAGVTKREHRYLAAKRIDWAQIEADVRPGTREDALWFALGANRTHGRQLNERDKKHAILLALNTFYFNRDCAERSAKDIARHIGCDQAYVQRLVDKHQDMTSHILPERVTGKDGKSYPATRKSKPAPVAPTEPPAPPRIDRSKKGVEERREPHNHCWRLLPGTQRGHASDLKR